MDEGTSSGASFKKLEKAQFQGTHKRAVSSVAWAPSHLTTAPVVASGSADGTAKIWKLPDPDDTKKHKRDLKAMTTLSGHSRGLNHIAWSTSTWSPPKLATASDDKTCRLWDVVTGDPLVEFRGHLNFCFCVAVHPTHGNLLVSGSFDETVKLWDVRSGDCVSTLPAHSDPVTMVDFSRDGTCICSSSHDGLIRLWDTATGECLKTIYAPLTSTPAPSAQAGTPQSVAMAGISEAGVAAATAAAAAAAGTSNAAAAASSSTSPPVSFAKYSPNGNFILSSTLDGRLRLWKTRTSTCSKTYHGSHLNSKYCMTAGFYLPQDSASSVVTGSENGDLTLYDLQTQQVQQTLPQAHDDVVMAVSCYNDPVGGGDWICTGGMTQDPTIKFWRPNKT
uniref:Anaphase-promoting complex subunit 4 WD40 domain-containing protein n=1 Tax=Grammatophora oceanica TaxID=210454 RepID=A0A7S1Y411_9STRA|mmetsp:Transcript_18807/g.27825  ORF Transcript_18807/g.27825 Transcript_18807/m.27825 type:complete len:391 (+) Transcript_18807:1-1173(+)